MAWCTVAGHGWHLAGHLTNTDRHDGLKQRWTSAFDYTHRIERDHGGELAIDQRQQLAPVMALISIGHELSAIYHAGINPSNDSRA